MKDTKINLIKCSVTGLIFRCALSISALAFSSHAMAVCEYIVNNDWGKGFTATIKITNSSNVAVNGWNLAWQYSNNKITSSWNANITGTNPYAASALAWNSNIASGQSVSFGVQGDTLGGVAEKPVISGTLCGQLPSSSSSAKSSVNNSSSSVASSLRSSSTSAISSSLISSSNSSKMSSAASSLSSRASSVSGVGYQCNWYGTLYPLCVTTPSGWGYENNKSCISTTTCNAQPAPFGVVGGASSSSVFSSIFSSRSSSVSSLSVSSASSSAYSSRVSSASSSAASSLNGILFQEDFESGADNTQPAGWDNFIGWIYNAQNTNANTSYAVIETGRAWAGQKAIHFKGSPAQIVRKLPAGIQHLHMRAYVNLSKQLGNEPNDNHEHIMGLKKTPDANNEIRVGQIKGVLGTNEVPSDNIAPTMDKWYSGTQLNPNTWYCVETAIYADTPYNELYLWVDGKLVHSIKSPSDWNNGALGANWASDKFNYVMFGFHSFSGNTADVWMDNIVVSTQPIGCATQ